jgi:hypothetical protein
MRKQTLISAILILFAPLLCAQATGAHSVAALDFNVGLAGDCSVNVSASTVNPSGPPMQDLTILCQGKRVLSYSTQDTLVDLFPNYPHDDRIFARWEGGSHVRLTVFRVSGKPLAGTVVFDKQLEGAPDVVNTPDVLLVHNGKRWISGQADSLPTSTDVYRWNGKQYALIERWKWKEDMRYKDRFCVLDVKALSCPVMPLPLK